MGTNYYIIDKSEYCGHCRRGEKEIHLGKSSMGWCFSVHVYPEENITTLAGVIRMIGDNQIKDEYGQDVSKKEFLNIVKDRENKHRIDRKPYGYASWAEFHEKNNSIDGPKGLLRAKLSSHCVGHGSGTWDYMVGEYS